MNTKVTDNVELDFPARMSDGRQFTDYRQNCILNNALSQGKGSWEYRTFLTNNSIQIHDQMMTTLESQFACNSCTDNTVLPVKTIQNCNAVGCNYTMNDPNGIGLGRNYDFSQ